MDRLASHLAVLEQQGLLETWNDRSIRAGADWREEIRHALERAKVAVLLVSAHSLTSRFILDSEVSRLLERRAAEGVHILPVIVRASTWKQVPWLAAMQVRPRDGKPLASFKADQRDREMVKIAEEVLELVGKSTPTKVLSDEEPLAPKSSWRSHPPVKRPVVAQRRAERKVRVTVAVGDAVTFEADVLALKYAQALYGVDALVAERLSLEEEALRSTLSRPGKVTLIDTQGELGVGAVLFVGVEPLIEFRYKEIREFGRMALSALAKLDPSIRHVALTLHGLGYGLDEAESFASEFAGVMDALEADEYPPGLERVTFVELNPQRARRLKQQLGQLLPGGPAVRTLDLREESQVAAAKLRDVGSASEKKPYVFVAMPFSDEMEDVWELGIRASAADAGLLCERADLSSFFGDVVQWIKSRIEGAKLVVADLSDANPNVYLEVGYAWGKETPTILLANSKSELKFDTRGQRCLLYKNVTDLKKQLSAELRVLKDRYSA